MHIIFKIILLTYKALWRHGKTFASQLQLQAVHSQCLVVFPPRFSSTIRRALNYSNSLIRPLNLARHSSRGHKTQLTLPSCLACLFSSGSSGRVGGGEKHKIYAAAFGSHLVTYFHRAGGGGMAHSTSPPDPLLLLREILPIRMIRCYVYGLACAVGIVANLI